MSNTATVQRPAHQGVRRSIGQRCCWFPYPLRSSMSGTVNIPAQSRDSSATARGGSNAEAPPSKADPFP